MRTECQVGEFGFYFVRAPGASAGFGTREIDD